MIRCPSLAVALLATLASAAPIAHQSQSASAPVPARQVMLVFDERGTLDPASEPARASLLSMAAGSSDVFVLSHGWRNDAASADCRYQQQIEGISAALPPTARPVFVKIVWPSAVFPVMHDRCGSEPNRPYLADQQSHTAPSELRTWAVAAFPRAAGSRRFSGEIDRLAALLNTSGAGQDPDASRVRDAATILVRWRDTADGPEMARARTVDGPGERALAATVDDAVAAFKAIQSAPLERSPWTVVPGFAEVFSFWTMKARAGIVGSAGVHDVIKALAASLPSSTRVHLIGHSFGGKLLASAIVGRAGAEPTVVESLTILQGALSHFAFSTTDQIRALDVPTTTGGAYAGVLERRLAAVLAVTYSEQDRENQRWYPLGTTISRDAFERGVPLYAALGARGLEGPAAVAVKLREESLAARYNPERPRVFNVDASAVILGHSDVMQPPVFKMIADVVAVANRARAAQSLKK